MTCSGLSQKTREHADGESKQTRANQAVKEDVRANAHQDALPLLHGCGLARRHGTRIRTRRTAGAKGAAACAANLEAAVLHKEAVPPTHCAPLYCPASAPM